MEAIQIKINILKKIWKLSANNRLVNKSKKKYKRIVKNKNVKIVNVSLKNKMKKSNKNKQRITVKVLYVKNAK